MKGFIYIIRSHQTDDVYYGSTIEMLCRRMAKHRSDYKKWLNKTMNYITSFELLKYEDAYIELVEELEINNKQELHAREGHCIRGNKCVNKNIPNRTIKELYEDNKTKYAEQHKQYYQDNRNEILERVNQYREANRDKINERRRQKRAAKRAESKLF